jgi:hypothetical protein
MSVGSVAGFIKASSEDRFQFIVCTRYSEVSSEIKSPEIPGEPRLKSSSGEAQEPMGSSMCASLGAILQNLFPKRGGDELHGEVGGMPEENQQMKEIPEIRCSCILALICASRMEAQPHLP